MLKYLLFFTLVFWSCQPATETDILQQRTSFFDLKTYFKEEAQRLQENKIQVRKKVTLNGEVEEKDLSEINFEEEFQGFINSDINKAAWLDKYRIDSAMVNGNLQRLTYKASDKKLKTREISIQFEGDKPVSIHILNRGDNAIAETQQELIYLSDQGYQLKGKQDMTLSAPRILDIEVTFLKN